MTPELVTVGGLTVDNVVAADGTVALAQAGGNGAYSAVGALIWRPRVGLVSHALASYPRDVIARFEAAGMDLGGVLWSEERLACCNWFIYDAEGRREEGLAARPKPWPTPASRPNAFRRSRWRPGARSSRGGTHPARSTIPGSATPTRFGLSRFPPPGSTRAAFTSRRASRR